LAERESAWTVADEDISGEVKKLEYNIQPTETQDTEV
jgi:hypothetical protein